MDDDVDGKKEKKDGGGSCRIRRAQCPTDQRR